MKSKMFTCILILCMAGMSMLGAAGTSETKTTEKMELTFFYPVMVGGPLTALIDKICADYNQQNPNVVIKPVYTGNYDDTVVKIQTAIQGKNPPDFFINLATQRFSMASTEWLSPSIPSSPLTGPRARPTSRTFLRALWRTRT
jgi:sn-glycerol 3-phosphate transport system substrate-binding protein